MSTHYSDEFDLDIRLFASQNQIVSEFAGAEKKRTKKNTCADDTCVSCKKTCGDDTCRTCGCEPTQRKSCDGSCFLTCSTCAGEATCNFARAPQPKGKPAKGSKKGKKGPGKFLVCK